MADGVRLQPPSVGTTTRMCIKPSISDPGIDDEEEFKEWVGDSLGEDWMLSIHQVKERVIA